MRPKTVSCARATNSYSSTVPLNWREKNGFAVSVQVDVAGDATYRVEYTMANVLAGQTAAWLTAPSSTGLESIAAGTDEIGAIAFPCTAIRLFCVNQGTTGAAATMTVLSAG